ncbi:hypothetical protein BS78_08G033400 [Paspalum vaginatum]|nr:hypothetical protein BS78_08G033400 [Paspalum vaginatum]
MKLAIKVMQCLGQNNCLYFTYSQILVDTLNSNQRLNRTNNWTIRPLIAQIKQLASQQQHSFLKIPRQRNRIAHNLSRRGRQSLGNASSFSCRNHNHQQDCNIMSLMQNSSWEEFKFVQVNCL